MKRWNRHSVNSQKREQPEHTVDEQKIVVVNIQYRLGKYQ